MALGSYFQNMMNEATGPRPARMPVQGQSQKASPTPATMPASGGNFQALMQAFTQALGQAQQMQRDASISGPAAHPHIRRDMSGNVINESTGMSDANPFAQGNHTFISSASQLTPEAVLASQGPTAMNQWATLGAMPGVDGDALQRANNIVGQQRGAMNVARGVGAGAVIDRAPQFDYNGVGPSVGRWDGPDWVPTRIAGQPNVAQRATGQNRGPSRSFRAPQMM